MKQNKCCKDIRKQIRKLESLKEEDFIKLIEDIESDLTTFKSYGNKHICKCNSPNLERGHYGY